MPTMMTDARQMRQLFTGMHDSSHCLHRLLQENSVAYSHVAQPQELSGAIRKNKQILKTHFYYMPCKTFNECSWIAYL